MNRNKGKEIFFEEEKEKNGKNLWNGMEKKENEEKKEGREVKNNEMEWKKKMWKRGTTIKTKKARRKGKINTIGNTKTKDWRKRGKSEKWDPLWRKKLGKETKKRKRENKLGSVRKKEWERKERGGWKRIRQKKKEIR